jgi:hypothetical protein
MGYAGFTAEAGSVASGSGGGNVKRRGELEAQRRQHFQVGSVAICGMKLLQDAAEFDEVLGSYGDMVVNGTDFECVQKERR